MSSVWTHFLADIADWFPGGLYGMGLVLLAIAVAIGLAIQESGLFKWRRRRRRTKRKPLVEAVIVPDTVDDTELPLLPSEALLARAQQFMASGDYRRAIREWLRVTVRELVEAEVIDNRPGWTVTELAAAAGVALPQASGALSEAAAIFSGVWYGGFEAGLDQAVRIRGLREAVSAAAEQYRSSAGFSREAV